jgi:hydrogenase maturation protease
MKTLIVGMGNPILTDDGIGIYVVQELVGRIQRDDVDVAEACVGGMRLLGIIAGYERVILVDAIQTPGGRPGEILRLHSGDLRCSMHAGCTHDLSLAGALALGRGLGMVLPDDDHFQIVAIEVEDVLTFGEGCTPAVTAAIPQVADHVLAMLAEAD